MSLVDKRIVELADKIKELNDGYIGTIGRDVHVANGLLEYGYAKEQDIIDKILFELHYLTGMDCDPNDQTYQIECEALRKVETFIKSKFRYTKKDITADRES